jgi:hypothetical protein
MLTNLLESLLILPLQKKYQKADRTVSDLRKRLTTAERELFEVEGNPYYMKTEDVDSLRYGKKPVFCYISH